MPDWGLLAKSAVSLTFAFGATYATSGMGDALLKGGAAGFATYLGTVLEKAVNNRLKPAEKSAYEAAIDAAKKRIENYAQDKNLSDDDCQAALDALLPMLSSAALSPTRQVAADYNGATLANDILNKHARVGDALGSAKTGLCRELLAAGLEAALANPDMLRATEAAFRAEVLESFHQLKSAIDGLPAEAARAQVALLNKIAAKMLLAPNTPAYFIPGSDSTTFLLSAEFELTPLIGRDPVMEELKGWCGAASRFDIRVYTGVGGVGKTRLFRTLCREMEGGGWVAGFVHGVADQNLAAALTSAVLDVGRALLVIDYADRSVNSPAIELALSIARAAAQGQACVRVVLISRTHTEWWNELCARSTEATRSLLKGAGETPPPPVPVAAITRLEDRQALFRAAINALAARLSKPVPAKADHFDLSDKEFDQPLSLLMAALALVEQPDAPVLKGRINLLDWVLDRQKRLWAKGLGDDYANLNKACAQTVAVAHMRQGVPDRGAAVALLRKIPAMEGLQSDAARRKIIEVLRAQHPGDQYLNGLYPDAVGQRLATLEQLDEIGLAELGAET